jgi:predicted permease
VPQNLVLVETDLHMSGYTDEQMPQMQRRMIDAIADIPGVTAVGYSSQLPLSLGGGDSYVFTDSTTDFRPTNQAADAMNYNISPGFLAAARTSLLAGRDLTFADDSKAPKVALVNREFAVKVFGSVDQAVGGHFKFWNGLRAEVVGVVEDGKYRSLTEEQKPAMFFSFQQQKASGTWLLVRSERDPSQISGAVSRALHGLDAGLPLAIRTWDQEMGSALFAARVATVALGVLGLLGAMLAITGIFGMASYTVSKRLRELGIRIALGARRKQVLRAALGRAFVLLSVGSAAGLVLGVLATKVLSYIVYQASPNDPLVLSGVVLTMLLLGLVASLIPAQKALSVDPMILLREE